MYKGYRNKLLENNEINKKMDERLKPIEEKVGSIEKNVNLLISNICPKNGL